MVRRGSRRRRIDGDRTEVWWQTLQTSFTVDPVHDQVWGSQWTPGDVITVSIAGVSGGPWTETADGSGDFHLDLSGFYDVASGDDLTVSDEGTHTKDHTVTELAVTGVNVDTDTVSGTAQPDSLVNVKSIARGSTTNK